MEKSKTQLAIHFLKANAFRVVHSDGVFGGPTPGGKISMAFFSERLPLPTKVVHSVELISEEKGELKVGPEIREAREQRDGIVRELEVDVIMDLQTAAVFHEWLGSQLKSLQTRGVK